ncbi:response regulator [Geminocystis sp. GBBB08]|uniref:response regulator n=1 Tax=Geminocystis sp. GBBB08 TaxID=2604140 RepID=UPI0027E3554B|nr:response regulator [Geminocystis sp. GBBB08]MBL1210298.1 response regulator [Geminocystis sp. GBBB08]
MSYPKSFVPLINSIEKIFQDQISGYITISNENFGKKIHFCEGKIIYVNYQHNRLRHWQKKTNKYLPKWDSSNIETNSIALEQLWEVKRLNQGLEKKEISLVEVNTFIKEILTQCFFELCTSSDFKYRLVKDKTNKYNYSKDLGLNQDEFRLLLKDVVQKKKNWDSLGLGSLNLNLSPYLKSEQNRESLPLSSHYFEGNHTLWEIATEEQKYIADVAFSVSHLIKENLIELKWVNDSSIKENKSEVITSNSVKKSSNSVLNLSEFTKQYLIAIIDDSALFQSKLGKFLEDSNYNIFGITEPISGMGKLIDQKPALILLDTKMPTVDGYSVCKFLRSTTCLNEIPIVLLTDNDNQSEREYASFIQANDIFCKESSLEKLTPIIQKYIPSVKTTENIYVLPEQLLYA